MSDMECIIVMFLILLRREFEVKNGDQDRIESEFGDVLFALVNYSRFINVNPEDALEKTNKRFIQRFKLMEQLINNKNLQIEKMNLVELDKFWEKAKKQYLTDKSF